MNNCDLCQKRMTLRILIAINDLKVSEIALAIHVSESLVRKHIEGIRYCPSVDEYIFNKCLVNKDKVGVIA